MPRKRRMKHHETIRIPQLGRDFLADVLQIPVPLGIEHDHHIATACQLVHQQFEQGGLDRTGDGQDRGMSFERFEGDDHVLFGFETLHPWHALGLPRIGRYLSPLHVPLRRVDLVHVALEDFVAQLGVLGLPPVTPAQPDVAFQGLRSLLEAR